MSLRMRTIADELLHSKQQKECDSFLTTANYPNYCGDSPCGIHPFSKLRKESLFEEDDAAPNIPLSGGVQVRFVYGSNL